MAKIGGNRNFGWGKQLAWAGKQALRQAFGHGRFATVAAHAARWSRFVDWARDRALRDARDIRSEHLRVFGAELAAKVADGEMRVAYAQNLLSSVNITLEALRGDRHIYISPSETVGQRSFIRQTTPATLDRDVLDRTLNALMEKGDERAAAAASLAREFGLRMREASLLDARKALRQADRYGRINITAGTKGGRGKGVDRWVPVSKSGRGALKFAKGLQGTRSNLIPDTHSWRQWKDALEWTWRKTSAETGAGKFHDLRAAYACDRYTEITGRPAPVVAGERLVDKEVDREARQIISQELGHGRIDVVASYIGPAK